ncbi:hypothetical protein TNCT_712551 [Trichonephila clavata]|uniref:Uncharacterized protein n=1 Tax=Trichonephila clavata TaxID=2740835 RepID=A0A8X6KYB4_TRICU|nr:hypothetical protein TNCT_712551 [Trichonephila clavata]
MVVLTFEHVISKDGRSSSQSRTVPSVVSELRLTFRYSHPGALADAEQDVWMFFTHVPLLFGEPRNTTAQKVGVSIRGRQLELTQQPGSGRT